MEFIQDIKLELLNDEGTQTREGLREATAEEYAAVITGGGKLPPALVYAEGGSLYLADGFHRKRAYFLAGISAMPCQVKQGSRWDAICAGLRANREHRGERLTQADKRRSIRMILRERPDLADHEIAKLCDCDHKTVGARRAEMKATGEIPNVTQRIGRDGRTYKVARPDGPRQDQSNEAAENATSNRQVDQPAVVETGGTSPCGPNLSARAPAIPSTEIWVAAAKALGNLRARLVDMNETKPDERRIRECNNATRTISAMIDEWQRDTGVKTPFSTN